MVLCKSFEDDKHTHKRTLLETIPPRYAVAAWMINRFQNLFPNWLLSGLHSDRMICFSTKLGLTSSSGLVFEVDQYVIVFTVFWLYMDSFRISHQK